jgi:hypothetical protein
MIKGPTQPYFSINRVAGTSSSSRPFSDRVKNRRATDRAKNDPFVVIIMTRNCRILIACSARQQLREWAAAWSKEVSLVDMPLQVTAKTAGARAAVQKGPVGQPRRPSDWLPQPSPRWRCSRANPRPDPQGHGTRARRRPQYRSVSNVSCRHAASVQ